MAVGDRISLIIKELGIAKKTFAETLNISTGNLSDWISTKRNSNPSLSSLKRINDKFGIDLTWLLTGKGKMFITDRVYESDESNQTLHVVSDIAAGEPVESTGERLDSFTIGRSFVRDVNDIFCFRVNGRSMEPDIQHQDLVLIKKDSNWKGKEDEICAVRIDGEITLKRIVLDHKHNMLVLISDNKDYMPIVVDTKLSDVFLIGPLHIVVRRLKA